jgi:hypothetical protein
MVGEGEMPALSVEPEKYPEIAVSLIVMGRDGIAHSFLERGPQPLQYQAMAKVSAEPLS